MDWFSGSVADAVRCVKEKSCPLLVFVRGTDDASKSVDDHFDGRVASVCAGSVCLRLDASSHEATQFSAVYALLTVPCVYLIAPSGKVIDVKIGPISNEELVDWLTGRIQQGSGADDHDSSTKNSIKESATSANVKSPATENGGPLSAAVVETMPSEHVEPILSQDVEATLSVHAQPASVGNVSPAPSETEGPTTAAAESLRASATETDSVHVAPLESRVQHAFELMEAKKREKAEEEKKEFVETETKRRELGKSLQQFKERQQAREVEEAMAERRRDEIESRRLREQLRKQIEDDRKAKLERDRMLNPDVTQSSQPVPPLSNSPKIDAIHTPSPVSSDQVRLQLRLVDGSHFIGRFPVNATLSGELRTWLQHLAEDKPAGIEEINVDVSEETKKKLAELIACGYRFRLLHPSKLFEPEEEARSMGDLGLCPSAVLMIVPNKLSHFMPTQVATGQWYTRVYNLVANGLETVYTYFVWTLFGAYSYGSSFMRRLTAGSGRTGERSSSVTTSRNSQPLNANRSNAKQNRSIRRLGNTARLSHLPDDSDDEQARWNGNSTEQL
ncbi:unnamed protein product [Calicophoron daubneyi]|uniref:UBX domain-containing protein 4 n=1 Tax=Calicophoron daubneyi TaxID=300641 RepID=A0AAV2T1Q2_CALDB